MSNTHKQPIAAVKHHNIALLFVNFLQTLALPSEIIKEDNGYVIYCPEEFSDAISREFELFIQNPYHEKYQTAAWQHGEASNIDDNYPKLSSTFQKQFLSHAGLVTLTVFVLCWAVFLIANAGFNYQIFSFLRFYSELSLAQVVANPLKIIGPAFFHFSWLHIVFNTMWWWQLGGSIEKNIGKHMLLNIFVVSAILSNVGQFLVSGANFGGLSGVVYALVGYVWWMGWLMPEKGLTIAKPLVGFLLIWMMLGFAQLLPINMANTAHLMGLISGCFLAWLSSFQASKKNN